jgi:hypothetical protein
MTSSISTEIGSGAARAVRLSSPAGLGPLDGRGRRAHEPGVDRQTVSIRGLLDSLLQLVGKAQVDSGLATLPHRARSSGAARGPPLLGARRIADATFDQPAEVGRWRAHHKLWIAAPEAKVDRAGREVPGDLGRRDRQRLQERQPDRGVERSGEPFGQRAGLFPARC